MVRIRLRRVGLKKQPSYRVVVADQRSSRDGRFIEIIGHYNPRTKPTTAVIDEGRALYWLSNGAQPSETVRRVFGLTGTWGRYERMGKGEEIEALVQEAEAEQAAAEPVSPKTRYPSPGPGESKQKAREAAAILESAAASETADTSEAEEVSEAADDEADE